MARIIRLLVVHCTASPNDRTLFAGTYGAPGFRSPAMEVDAWHQERGFERDAAWRARMNPSLAAIGYHYLVARNGAVFSGRHEDEMGAHAAGWNRNSLGICLVGTDKFTLVQWLALRANITGLAKRLDIPLEPPELAVDGGKKGIVVERGVCGHRDLPGHNKACPGFDVAAWLANEQNPMPEATA